MSERLITILTESFTKILIPGLTVTIPLTAISFALAMVIAVVVALINRHWRREYQQLLDVRKRFEAIFTDDGK